MAESISASPTTDPRSGFCTANSTFYSKRNPIPLPPNPSLDVTTFISSRAHRGEVAFIDAATGRRLSFADLWRAVDAVATSLSADFGIRKGHVILLLTPNSIYFPIVCLAVMSLGAVITTTNPLNTSGEISKQIADSKPALAFTIPQLLPKLADSNLPIVLLGGGGADSSSSKLRIRGNRVGAESRSEATRTTRRLSSTPPAPPARAKASSPLTET